MDGMIRWGAWCAMAGGALRVGSSFIPWRPNDAALEMLYATIDLGMLFGLIAVGLATNRTLGRVGFASWVVATAALASIVGPDPVAFGIDFYRLGAGVFVLALGAMAAVLAWRRTMTGAASLWIASALSGVVAGATGSTAAFVAAGVTLGLGFVLAGKALLAAQQ